MSAPFLLLCLGVALAACGPSAPDGATPAPDADVGADRPAAAQPVTRLASMQTSGYARPLELVVRDAAGWQAAWATLHDGMPGEPPPAVDFDGSMVLLVAIGERPTGGYDVRVDSVVPQGRGGRVHYTVVSPGPSCMTAQSLTSPVDVVRAPRLDGDVTFERRAVTQDC